MVILSSTLITLALVFYSMGVWSERIAHYLKPWHVIAFWTGFFFDVSGSAAMHRLARGPFNLRAPHTLTGQIALWLMLSHAVWSTRVSRRGGRTVAGGFSPLQSVCVPGLADSLLRWHVSGNAAMMQSRGLVW